MIPFEFPSYNSLYCLYNLFNIHCSVILGINQVNQLLWKRLSIILTLYSHILGHFLNLYLLLPHIYIWLYLLGLSSQIEGWFRGTIFCHDTNFPPTQMKNVVTRLIFKIILLMLFLNIRSLLYTKLLTVWWRTHINSYPSIWWYLIWLPCYS